MNRTFGRPAALLWVMLVALPARAQVPLVVGAVRDEQGVPIQDARVTGRRTIEAPVSASTDAAGTFALRGPGIVEVLVTCRYCRPTLAPVRPGQPVVVIVRRYQALAGDSPSTADLENLPYAHVESAVALRPFTLLSQTSSPYPGSLLSDRGLSASGSLLVDDGAPNYDLVAGQSPYALIPAQYERTADLQDASNAYLYGDQAAGGIVSLQPFAGDSGTQSAGLGSDVILRAQAQAGGTSVAAASFSNSEESRQRSDLFGSWQLSPDQSLQVAAGTAQGRAYDSPESAFAGNFSFADAAFADANLANLSLSAEADRGDYALGESEYATTAVWSDAQVNAGVHSTGPIVAFADFGFRASTGSYAQQAYPARIGATLGQTRADAGLRAAGKDYTLTAGVGAFWVDYSGGSSGISAPAKAALAVPSFQARLFPDRRWSALVEESGSFTLPTFEEQYTYPWTSVQIDRNDLLAAALTYSDQSRLRLSFEEASQRVAGATAGTVTSAGLSAVWQISPEIALRAWTMHVSDTVPAYTGALPFDAVAPTMDALWLTYDVGNGVRLDAIYRRDLLDGAPFFHFDGDVSGPIIGRLRWYAGGEDRMRRTFTDAGLRFEAQ